MTDAGRDARHEILARTLEGLRDRRLGCLSVPARISTVENDLERILEFLLGDYPERKANHQDTEGTKG